MKALSPRDREALETFDTLPDLAYVRLPVVSCIFAISDATVWRWVKAGKIPEPRKLGPMTTAWNVGELRRTLAGSQPVDSKASDARRVLGEPGQTFTGAATRDVGRAG